MTDRNGTTHTYAYDALGRMTSDTITTLGSGVNGSIMRLGYTYNSQGLPYQQTSYSDTSGTNVVNQVQDVYNGLGQLTGEYQEHAGPVVATSSTEVTYAYTEMASGVNNSRMTSMTYPDGRIVHYGYNTGIDDAIRRLSYTADDNGSGSAGVHLEDDQYLGLDTVVVRAHPQDGVDMSLIKQPSDTVASSDGGDQYTGLDRFGRVIDQNWITNDGSTNAASVDRYQYGYDSDGNVLYKRNVTKSVFSELYTYDNLNQLGGYQRGILDSAGTSIASVAASQTYNLDPLGNRTSVSTTNADTVGGSVTNDYTTNAQNQIESMTDASGTNTASLGYDNDGNTLADDAGNTYTYDAWNRQATVSTSIQSGSNTVTVGETYGYDANGKRITSYVTGSAASGNTADNLYFSDQWQIVQETLVNTVGSGTSAVTTTTRNEYTWASGVYVNALIERDQTQTISPMGATNGLYASYFGAGSPNSLPVHETDSNINFDWSSTGPAALPSQGTNAFYVRWTGEVDAASAGAYTFNLGTGGDVEVKIDGKVVILLLDNPAGDIDGNGVNSLDDLNIFSANFGKIVPPGTGGDFNDNGTVDLGDLNTFSSGSGDGSPQWTTSTGSITLSAGEHNIEIDYFQPQGLSAGEAGITLSWVTPSNTNSVTIPTGSFTPQQSSTRLYAMQDANNNVTGFLDVNGNVVERVVYTPYGEATVLNANWSPSTATFGNDAAGWTIGFQGGYTDPLSGKVIFQHRDYDAVTGTWLEQDPMGYVDGSDTYEFVDSQPSFECDPAGLWTAINRQGKTRAIVCSNDSFDTWSALAKLAGMSTSDPEKWVRRADGTSINPLEEPEQGRSYSVPNVIYLSIGFARTPQEKTAFVASGKKATGAWAAKGYSIAQDDEMFADFADPNIYGFIFEGHGQVSFTIWLGHAWNTQFTGYIVPPYPVPGWPSREKNMDRRYAVGPGDFRPVHPIAYLDIDACASDVANWPSLVSVNGHFIGYTGKTNDDGTVADGKQVDKPGTAQ